MALLRGRATSDDAYWRRVAEEGVSGNLQAVLDEYVHLLSRVHYVLGVQYPQNAVAHGGIYKWTGDRDVPDIHNTLYDYGDFQALVIANLVSNLLYGFLDPRVRL